MALKIKRVTIKTPPDYTPFQKVNICGNRLENIPYILDVGGNYPILIGRGVIPYVWIYAPQDPTGQRWTAVVERSSGIFPGITVENPQDRYTKTIVKMDEKVLIEIIKKSDEEIEIPFIDLRPISLNIHGNREGLNVGGNKLTRNVMSGGNSFIAMN